MRAACSFLTIIINRTKVKVEKLNNSEINSTQKPKTFQSIKSTAFYKFDSTDVFHYILRFISRKIFLLLRNNKSLNTSFF